MMEFKSTVDAFLTARSKLCVSLILVLAIAAVYFPVRDHDFISLDDGLYVTQNIHVNRGLSVEGLKWALTTNHAGFWIPLTWVSLMIDSHLFGLSAGHYHVTNVMIHIVNTLLLFFVLRRMTGAIWPSSVVAILFAVHPIHVESVAWVSERKDVLFAFFWMLAMWFYVRYAQNPGIRRYIPLMLCYILGLMAKPMIVTLPFVLLLLDYWPLKRLQIKEKNHPAEQQQNLLTLVLEKVPLFILTVVVSVITFVLQKSGGAVTSLSTLPVSDRLFNSLISYVKYLGKMVWPHPLAVLYSRPDALPAWQWALSLILLLAFSILIFHYRKNHPYLPVGWLWFLGTMVPVIGIVQSGPQTMADRFAYMPFIGLYIMLAWGLQRMIARWPNRKAFALLTGAIAVTAFMLVARIQVGYWSNDLTLYAHTLKTTSNNFVVHRNYGMALAYKGRLNEALFHFQRALEIDPSYAQTYHDMGTALMLNGDFDESVKYLEHSLKLRPNYSKSHYNLGLALMRLGRFKEAEYHFRRAVQIDPEFKKDRKNLQKAMVELEP
jgi:tetratricopeptide (TPR) repeat protein